MLSKYFANEAWSVFSPVSGPCLPIFLLQKKKSLLFIECLPASLSHSFHSQMNGVQNMEGEFQPTTLHIFIDRNHDTFQPTFFHSHTAFQTIQHTITELAAVFTPFVSTLVPKRGRNLCCTCFYFLP